MDQVGKDQRPAVEAYGSGNQKADLFCESRKASGRGARGCDQGPGVDDTGEMGIFVVKGLLDICGGGFIVFVVFAKGFVVGDGGVKGFAGCEGSLEFCTLFSSLGVAESKGAAVEVVSPLAGLSSLLDGSVGVWSWVEVPLTVVGGRD